MIRAWANCLIALGSNQGNKKANLRYALAALENLPRTRLLRRSHVYESKPVGGPRQADYLNVAIWIKTRLTPMGLLIELKRLEALRGRTPGHRWGARPLDCDLIFYDDLRSRERFLQIPHPRALKRRFVLQPLVEIRGGWTPPYHPKRTLKQWLRRLKAPKQHVKMNKD